MRDNTDKKSKTTKKCHAKPVTTQRKGIAPKASESSRYIFGAVCGTNM